MKWQQVAVLLTVALGATGAISYLDLFGGLFQLSGMNYTYSGDIKCSETCESYINVTTSYWAVCFEHSNNPEVIYKKVALSRTLWVNLNNVTSIVSTKPEVDVDWLVPAVGVNKWRPVKDGDCWMRGKVNKNKLVGHKAPRETVKWGFQLTDKTKQYILLDPKWEGITERQITKHEFTATSEKTEYDDGTGLATIHSAMVYADSKGTKIEDAKSLKDCEFCDNFKIIMSEDKENYPIEVIDYNYTAIIVRPEFTDKQLNKDIPLLVFDKQNKSKSISVQTMRSMTSGKMDTTIVLPFGFDRGVKFGMNSTIIILNDSTFNMGDTYVENLTPTVNHDGISSFRAINNRSIVYEPMVMMDISSIPAAVTIDWANISLYININGLDLSTEGFNISSHRITSSWLPSTVTWNTKPVYNITKTSIVTMFGGAGEPFGNVEWNVTSIITADYLAGQKNTSIYFSATQPFGSPASNDYVIFDAEESGYGAGIFPPKITIAYTLSADTVPPTWSNNKTQINSAGNRSYFNISWTDETGFSTALFESNISGSQANYTMNLITGTTYNYSAIITNAGNYYWKSWGNDTTNNRNVTDIWIFSVTDSYPPKYSNIGVSNSLPVILDNVIFSSYWTDDTALDKFIFSWNGTGVLCDTWANDTAAAFSSGWANVTKQIPAACLGKIGGIAWQVFANDTVNNKNNTPITLSFSGEVETVLQISNCIELNQDGRTYNLTTDILNSGTQMCMNITGENIILDCNGHEIQGNDAVNFGVYIDDGTTKVGNITIKNCTVSHWRSEGFWVDQIDKVYFLDSRFFNNTVNNGNGGQIARGKNYLFNRTLFQDNQDGIRLWYAYNVTIAYSNFINQQQYGVMIDTANGNVTIHDSLFRNNSVASIDNDAVTGLWVYNNLFNDSKIVNTAAGTLVWFNTTNNTGTRIYSAGTNIWGNYYTNLSGDGYSDICSDTNVDGFCDMPFNVSNKISGNFNCDNYIDCGPLSNKYGTTPPSNVCLPPTSGTFNVTSWCNFTSTYQIAGDINCSSIGIMNITGTLNFTGSNQRFIMMDGCKRWLQGNGRWGKFS